MNKNKTKNMNKTNLMNHSIENELSQNTNSIIQESPPPLPMLMMQVVRFPK